MRKHVYRYVVGAAGIAGSAAYAGPSITVTPLLQGGQSFTYTDPDTMTEVTVTLPTSSSTFNSPTVSDNGDWAVSIRLGTALADRALVQNGFVVAKGGGQLPEVPPDSFSYTHTFSSEPVPRMNGAGDLLVRYGAVQQPGNAATKGGLYLNQSLLKQTVAINDPASYIFSDQLIFQVGYPDIATFPTASGPFLLNDNSQVLFRPTLGPSPTRVTLHRYTYDSNYFITQLEQLMLQDTEVPGLPGRNLLSIFVTENKISFNNDGDWAVLVGLDGDTTTNRAIIRNGVALAQSGSPSVVPGRNYSPVETTFSGSNSAVTLGPGASYAFRLPLDGDTATNSVIVKDGVVFKQKGGALPALGASATISSFGTDASPLFIDSSGRTYWKVTGASTDPSNATIAIMRDDEAIIRDRITEVSPGVFVRSIGSSDSFAVSPNGRFIILASGFNADPNASSGTAGLFLIDTNPPSACPGDFNGDETVDLADLIAFNTAWQPNIGLSVPPGTMGDYNADGVVDLADLIAFNTDWQPNIGVPCP